MDKKKYEKPEITEYGKLVGLTKGMPSFVGDSGGVIFSNGPGKSGERSRRRNRGRRRRRNRP